METHVLKASLKIKAAGMDPVVYKVRLYARGIIKKISD